MKTKEEILAALESENYEVRHEEECRCSMHWGLDGSQLRLDVSADDCWHGNVLYIGEDEVAQHIFGYGPEVLADGVDYDDIPESIWGELCSDSSINVTHDGREKESLAQFLTEKKNAGWRLLRDNLRGFANEYALYLIAPDADNTLDDGRVIHPCNMDELSVSDFVDDYCYNGDAATEAFTSHEVVQ